MNSSWLMSLWSNITRWSTESAPFTSTVIFSFQFGSSVLYLVDVSCGRVPSV